jgi:Protein of unknown function (DUF3040)
MALSMDEQRILAEIERKLAADDPGLASCLTTFRRPGPGTVLRSPRARIIGSLFTVLLVALVSLTVYAMIPFRAHLPRNAITPSASVNTTLSAAGTQSAAGQQAADGTSSSTSGTSSTGASASSRPAGHSSDTAGAKTPWSKADGSHVPASPGTIP